MVSVVGVWLDKVVVTTPAPVSPLTVIPMPFKSKRPPALTLTFPLARPRGNGGDAADLQGSAVDRRASAKSIRAAQGQLSASDGESRRLVAAADRILDGAAKGRETVDRKG